MRREQEASNEDLLADDQAHSAALEEAVERALARAVREKPRLLPPEVCRDFVHELCRRGPEARRRWLRQCRWAARPEVVRTLLAEGRATSGVEPAGAERLARLALELTRCLKPRPFPALVADLEAEALGLEANALRVQERYAEAGELWEHISRLLLRGTRDALLLARLDHYHCAYLRARRDLPQAATAGWRSVRAFRRLGHETDAFLASITLASVLYAAAEFREALALFAQLRLGSLSPDLARRYRLDLPHATALHLIELGDFRPAQVLVARMEPLYPTGASSNLLLQLAWLKAKILAGHRTFGEAASAFRSLRQDYLARERPFDAALVGLDEMLCLAESGRFTGVCDVAREVLPVFERLELPTETATAVDTLFRAAERVRADLAQVRLVHGLLQPLRRLPPGG